MTSRQALVHYAVAVSGVMAIGIGFVLGWLLQVDWAGGLVIAGVVASMFFAFRSWYLGSRGVDMSLWATDVDRD